MKAGSVICLVIFVFIALLALAQMWFAVMPADLFFKTIITLVVGFVVVFGVTLVNNEYLSNKEMKDSNHID